MKNEQKTIIEQVYIKKICVKKNLSILHDSQQWAFKIYNNLSFKLLGMISQRMSIWCHLH